MFNYIYCVVGGGGTGTTGTNLNVGSSVYPHLYNIHTTLLQHHNSITNNTNVPINSASIDQSVSTTPQPVVNTTTTITTTTVINDHKQVGSIFVEPILLC